MSPQPGKWSDLNGSAPDNHDTALLLIDVINHFEFDRGEDLLRFAAPIAPKIARLKCRARQAGIPAIYVNDNFGRWQSNLQQLLQYCLQPSGRGQDFVQQLIPAEDDYFVLKPKHSGFYQTPLEILLKHLGTRRIIITGVSTNSCVLFTAHEGYMRDMEIAVPADCVAACTETEHKNALAELRTMMKADVSPSEHVLL